MINSANCLTAALALATLSLACNPNSAFAIPHDLSIPYPTQNQVEFQPGTLEYSQLFSGNHGRGENFWRNQGMNASQICTDIGVPSSEQTSEVQGKTIWVKNQLTNLGWLYNGFIFVDRGAALTNSSAILGAQYFNGRDERFPTRYGSLATFCKKGRNIPGQ